MLCFWTLLAFHWHFVTFKLSMETAHKKPLRVSPNADSRIPTVLTTSLFNFGVLTPKYPSEVPLALIAAELLGAGRSFFQSAKDP
jgi:hypothetical protein